MRKLTRTTPTKRIRRGGFATPSTRLLACCGSTVANFRYETSKFACCMIALNVPHIPSTYDQQYRDVGDLTP